MKKLLVLTIALVLIPAFAFASPDNASKFCKELIEGLDLDISQGQCVSTVQSCFPPGNDLFSGPLCICKFLRTAFPDAYNEIVGNNGLGACVQFFKN